ncbi:DnaJ domain-containing protein, partial [Rhexocercosporidium sp. MPI-PUGE-AT-0058]
MARPLASPDYYAILEVSPTAPISVIKESYRRLALRFHPDKNRDDLAGATQKFQELSRAWEILGDVRSRTEYD